MSPAARGFSGAGSSPVSLAASAGQKLFLRVSSYSQGDVGPVPVHVWLSSTSTTAPRVQVFSPRSGPRSGGTHVTLEGESLSATVTFGGAMATGVLVGVGLQVTIGIRVLLEAFELAQ